MNAQNTPKIKPILEAHQLAYIPEAHCYLKHGGHILDITFGNDNASIFEDTLLFEESILPNQIGSYKLNLHQTFLKSWIHDEALSLSFDQLWSIREACICKISE
jgi:hypothetical protein